MTDITYTACLYIAGNQPFHVRHEIYAGDIMDNGGADSYWLVHEFPMIQAPLWVDIFVWG